MWDFSNGRFPCLHKAPTYLPLLPQSTPEMEGRLPVTGLTLAPAPEPCCLSLTAVLPLGPRLQQEQSLSLESWGLAVPSPRPWPCHLSRTWGPKKGYYWERPAEGIPTSTPGPVLPPTLPGTLTGQHCFCALCRGAVPRQGPGGGAQACLSPRDGGTGVSLTLHAPCQPLQR